MMAKFLVALGVFVTILTAGAQAGFAETDQQQEAEAKAFFQQVIQNNQNPYIISLAKDNIHRLNGAPTSFMARHTSHRTFEVPLLSQLNNGLAVPSLINSKTMATLLVDTGSTYTVITPRLARKLGIQVTANTPRVSIITANGMVKAPKVTLRNVAIGQVKVKQVTAVIQDLGNDILLSGLLGMNFFEGMDLTVKRDRLIISVNDAS
jgi:aspartyl protease family protein